MALSNLSLSSTFFEHMTRTNQTVKVINDIEGGTHPLVNTVVNAAATASNVAALAVGAVVGNNTILSAISNGVNSIIVAMYDDIYADSNIARDKANVAYNQSNLTYDVANAAYNAANFFISNSSYIVSNVILSNTNTYNIIVNVAFTHINAFIANSSVIAIYGATNAAFGHANLAFAKANTANSTADAALALATIGEATAAAAFNTANSAGGAAQLTASFAKGNAAHLSANAAFAKANFAHGAANGAYDWANVVLESANNAFTQGTFAFNFGNTVNSFAYSVSDIAMAAFAKANVATTNVFNELSSTDSAFYPALVRSTSGLLNQINVSSTKLYYQPSTGQLTSYSFNSLSDENVKKDIVRVENALELIEKLHGVDFTFKESNTRSSGVIAQNLINVVPHLVYNTEGKPLTVNYSGLSALFIEAIKELNKEVKSIKRHLGM